MLVAHTFSFPYTEEIYNQKLQFSTWKKTFKRVYNTIEEEEHRIGIWIKNMAKIVAHNLEFDLKQKSYRMEMNHFGDLTSNEYRKLMNGYQMSKRKIKFNPDRASYLFDLFNTSIPEKVDWRDEGFVTPVKDQGQCGSCWSFSATGALEGQMKRKTGKLVSLSEQNLIDCSRPEGNHGCEGGLMDFAFEYIKHNQGVDTEISYPYEGKEKECRFSRSNIGGEDIGYVDLPMRNEEVLKQAVGAQGPISVAIDAGKQSFQFYASGIYDEPECNEMTLNHGVLVVGYGTDEYSGKDYWLVKNSWSSSWGENGYIKMLRGHNNQCGIATIASYPIV